MCRRNATTLATVFALVVVAGPSRAAIWNINPQGTGDAPTIQHAYDLASPGDLIILAPGVYMDSNTRTIEGHSEPRTTTAVAFMSPGVSIEGSGGADVTFIDGEGSHHGLFGTDTGAIHVREITFRRCTLNGGEDWGGGLMFHRSQPVVEHCVFVDCEALAGAGLFTSRGSGLVVRFNKFIDNTTTDLGGALEVAEHQPGLAIIENNTFVGNSADRWGGALLMNASTVHLANNIFAGNTAGRRGGALGCLNAVVTSGCNLFWENEAPADPHIYACSVVIGQDENLLADPLFCDPDGGDFGLMVGSPAAPDHPGGCGLRGACPVSCGPVSVKPESWAGIKSVFR